MGTGTGAIPTLRDLSVARARIDGIAKVTPVQSSETFSRLAGREAADRDVDAVHRGAADQARHDPHRRRAHGSQTHARFGGSRAHSVPGKEPPSISRFWPVM